MSDEFNLGQKIGELASSVERLSERVDAMDRELKEIHGAYARGKGILVGAMLMAGFGVGQLKDWVAGLIKD